VAPRGYPPRLPPLTPSCHGASPLCFNYLNCLEFLNLITAVLFRIQVFWDVALYRWIFVSRNLQGTVLSKPQETPIQEHGTTSQKNSILCITHLITIIFFSKVTLFPSLLMTKRALKRYPYSACSYKVLSLFMFYSTSENCTIYILAAEYYNYNPMINSVFAISISICPIKFSLL